MQRDYGRRTRRVRLLVMVGYVALLVLSPVATVGAAPPLAFTAPSTLAAGDSPYKVIAVDMNGDTFLDFVVSNRGGATNGQRVSIFLATVSMGVVTGYTRTDYMTGRSQRGLAVGDLNGDGRPDFVSGPSGGSCSTQAGGGMPYVCDGVFSVFLSTLDMMGNVTGYSRTDLPNTGNPTKLPFTMNDFAIADLDGDGRQDIVIAGSVPFGTAAGTVRVYRTAASTSTYTFSGLTDYAVGGNPDYPVIRDLNGDGKLDIAVVASGSNQINVLTATTNMMGNVTGYTRTDLSAGSNAIGLAAGDFNGDGKLDLVTANLAFSGNGTLRLFLANAMGGGFAPATTQAVIGSAPNDIATGDFNGDGVLDIAVPNSTGSQVNVLLNNGTGTFTRNNFASGSNPFTATVGDFNKDGRVDIAVANSNTSGTVGILYGTTPTTLAATAGTPQAVLVNASYPTALKATVTDTSGRPLGSIPVTFTIPASGTTFGAPGGLFPMGGAGVSTDRLSAVATTDNAGVATAPTITAGVVAGTFNVVASVQEVASTASFALTVNPGMAVIAQPFAGNGQTLTVNTAAPIALQTRVTDANGNPRSGDTVTFTVNAMGGAGGTFAGGMTTTTAITNTSGVATAPTFTANGVAGPYTVTAADGAAMTSFSLTNAQIVTDGFTLTGLPTSVVAGAAQMLTVTAINRSGATATGYTGTVRFTSSDPQAVLPTDSTLTSGTGTFPVTLKTAGSRTIIATDTATNTITGSITVTVTPGVAVAPVAIGGTTPQSAAAGTTLAVPLAARVTDAYGNTRSGDTVTFTVNAMNGAGGTFAGGMTTTTATTDASGVATAPTLTAGGTPGQFTVSASNGVGTAATYTITVTAGGTARLAVTGATTTTAGNPLTLTVTAQDGPGNTATGYSGTVHFTSSDPQAVLPADSTLTNGAAMFSVTLKTAGSQTVTATDTTTNTITGTITVVVTPAAAVAPVVVSGTPQSVAAGATLPAPLVARVTDAYGNARSGDTVTFTVNAMNGAGGTFAGGMTTATVMTDGVGAATAPTLTASGTPGGFAVSASNGVGTPASFAVTVTAANATRLVLSGPTNSTAGALQTVTVTAKDASGNTATTFADTVTITTTDPQATVPPATMLMNGTGTFAVTLKTAGAQIVSATAPGGLVSSLAVTVAPTAASIVETRAGDGQATGINTPFIDPLVARVTDAYGNPVVGVTVVFAAPLDGPSGTFAPTFAPIRSVLTDTNGVATTPNFTANGTVGMYNVSVRANGVAMTAQFTLKNVVVNAAPIPRTPSMGVTTPPPVPAMREMPTPVGMAPRPSPAPPRR